jgi:hypothetical protein
LPFALQRMRCALTAPFHPYLIPRFASESAARSSAQLSFPSDFSLLKGRLPYPSSKRDFAALTHRKVGAIGGLFSVALFLASRRAVISRHPTLWSPDFPLRAVRTIV